MNPSSRHAPLTFFDSTHVRVGRRTLLYFGGGNYLGLARHPQVLAAMRAALDEGMTQTGASRSTTGEHSLYTQAERALAQFFRQPAAALVSCGYLAPLAAVHALRRQVTHVVLANWTHACVQDAAAASGLPVVRLGHEAKAELENRLKKLPRGARPLLLTDGTHGTRGGLAPLDEFFAALAAKSREVGRASTLSPRASSPSHPRVSGPDATDGKPIPHDVHGPEACPTLLVDDAHGAGTVGPGGRGAVAHFALNDPRIVQTISLAKAFGVGGGAVLGTREFISELQQRAAAFVGSTALPLVVPAGILVALRLLQTEPERVRRLQANMRKLHALLPSHPELSNSPLTPVTAVTSSTPARAEAMRRALLRAGIYPPFIRYLSGPEDGFFRFALNAEHAEHDVETLAESVRRSL